MIPDISLVREQHTLAECYKTQRKLHIDSADSIKQLVETHWYDSLKLRINNQLIDGSFATCKLEYPELHIYIFSHFSFQNTSEVCFVIMEDIFCQLKADYESAGYIVEIEKEIDRETSSGTFYTITIRF